jgi:hypothetical protein
LSNGKVYLIPNPEIYTEQSEWRGLCTPPSSSGRFSVLTCTNVQYSL